MLQLKENWLDSLWAWPDSWTISSSENGSKALWLTLRSMCTVSPAPLLWCHNKGWTLWSSHFIFTFKQKHSVAIFCFVFLWCSLMALLCSPGCSLIHSNPPTSDAQLLGLQAWGIKVEICTSVFIIISMPLTLFTFTLRIFYPCSGMHCWSQKYGLLYKGNILKELELYCPLYINLSLGSSLIAPFWQS